MRPRKRDERWFRPWLRLLAIVGLLYGFAAGAYPTGIYGSTKYAGGGDCTGCHTPSNTYQYGLPTVNVASGSTTGTLVVGHQASLYVSASPNGSHHAAGGGFDLYVTQGTIAVPGGNRLKICPTDADGGGGTTCTNSSSNQEITHSTEYAADSSGNLTFDQFRYTPASTGSATMWLCVHPTDGSYVNGGTPHADNQGPPVCTSQAITIAAAPVVNISLASSSIALGQSTTLSWSSSSTISCSASGAWSGSRATSGSVSVAPSAQGSYTYGLTCTGLDGSTTAFNSATLTVGPPVVASVAVTPVNPSIAKGLSQQFIATATYTDGSTVDVTSAAGINWQSLNTGVATINTTGSAFGAGVGSATIVATYSGRSGSTTLTVTAPTVTTVTVTPANPSIPKGRTQQFVATATFTDNSTQDVSGSASWMSANTGVATISSTGLASGVSQGGPVTITATYSGRSGMASLTVTAPVVTTVTVAPVNPSVAKGQTQQFTATATYSDNTTQDVTANASTSWMSTTTSVATVSPTGLASSANSGSTTISARYSGVSGSSVLTVTAAAVTSIAVTPGSASIAKGRTQQFTATATLTDSSTQDVTSAAIWSSSNPAVASIGANTGLASGASQGGPVTIAASYSGFSSSASLTVTAAVVTALNVSPGSASIAKGLSQQFSAIATYSDNSTQDASGSATWMSSNSGVATVSSTGLASGVGQGGPVTITASYSGFSSSGSLTVTAAAVTGVTVTPANASIAKGLSQQFTAIATYTDSTTLNVTANPGTTWSSSSPAATISSTGLASGVSTGTAGISAIFSGKSGGATLTVTAAAVTGLSVTPASVAIANAQTQQFTVTATYTDATTQNVTSAAAWSSSNTAVATIGTSTGLATGVSQGMVTVSAAYSGQTASASLSVTVLSAPANLQATASNMSASLNWTAVTGAASYNIYQATQSGSEVKVQSGVAGNNTVITGLVNGTSYFFKVSAVNAFGGEGALSNEASTSLRKSPTINVPAALTLSSTGYLTPFTPNPTAVDADGNPVAVTTSLTGPLRPGVYTVTYSARDTLGTTGSTTQTLNLLPLAHLSPDQLVGDNQTVQVGFLLNGLATTPVTLAYTVSGTAAALAPAGSGTVTLTSPKSSLSFTIPAGAANAPDDTLILTLSSANNAVLDGDVSSTVRIVHHNLAPVASIALSQSGQPRSVVFQDQGAATLSVTAADPNAGDVPLYDWSASDNALVPPTGNVSSFSFDPSGLKAGAYTVRVTARSQAGTAAQATLALVVQATEPVLSGTTDTNGDGIVDSIEGYLDAFGKAIPAYLDSDPGAPQALQIIPPGASGGFTPYLETQQGDRLRLGPTVLAAGRVSGATITAAEVASYGDGRGAVSNGADSYTNIGGLFDFEVHGVAPGATTQIVLPLQSAIRSGAVYRQYTAAAGWHDFVSDAGNSLASAHSSGGVCPGPGSTAYTAGLTAFNDCVRLTIQDGGPDDEDGAANGVVRDPGGVALAPSASAASGTPKPNAGALAPWVLLGLLAACACRRRRPINQGNR